MKFKDISEEDLRCLLELRSLFEQVSDQMSRISDSTIDKMLGYHTENHTLPHCARWGEQAVDELIAAALEDHVIERLREALHQVLKGDSAVGLADIRKLRYEVDPDLYEAALRELKLQ